LSLIQCEVNTAIAVFRQSNDLLARNRRTLLAVAATASNQQTGSGENQHSAHRRGNSLTAVGLSPQRTRRLCAEWRNRDRFPRSKLTKGDGNHGDLNKALHAFNEQLRLFRRGTVLLLRRLGLILSRWLLFVLQLLLLLCVFLLQLLRLLLVLLLYLLLYLSLPRFISLLLPQPLVVLLLPLLEFLSFLVLPRA